jgi:hypothetical protein
MIESCLDRPCHGWRTINEIERPEAYGNSSKGLDMLETSSALGS